MQAIFYFLGLDKACLAHTAPKTICIVLGLRIELDLERRMGFAKHISTAIYSQMQNHLRIHSNKIATRREDIPKAQQE
jgi:hypothetical protein